MASKGLSVQSIVGKRPIWILLFPFLYLMRSPLKNNRHWQILGVIAFIGMFNRYDITLFSLALRQIQDGLMIADSQVSTYAAIVRVGSMPAFLLFLLADRIGRRRVLVFSFFSYSMLTGMTGLVTTQTQFVVLQFLARTFLTTGYILGAVMLTEEFDEADRGWGIGAYGAMIAYGYGAAYPLFAVVDYLPFGWRTLYLLGFGGVLFVPIVWRLLPESKRFEQKKRQTKTLEPILLLIRMYPARILMTTSVFFLISFGNQAAGFLEVKYLQDVHGWEEVAISLMAILGGMAAIFLPTTIGQLSDRFGRRWMTIASLVMYTLSYLIFYNTSGLLLPLFWFGSIVAFFGANISIATYGAELFPTSYRSTAGGAQSLAVTIGAVLGLATESLLFAIIGSHWISISLMVLTILVGVVIVYLFFPETSGRTLEDISPELELG